MASLSETLRRAVLTSGKSVYEICKATGLDKGAMSRFMSGKDLRLESADKLAEFLGLKLVGRSDKGTRNENL